MQDVNDDMDELFKKAAENYPLNTNSSDWNEVQRALPTIAAPLDNTIKENKYRRFLWLLLFLPVIVLVNKYIFNSSKQDALKTSLSQNHQTIVPDEKNISKKNTAAIQSKGTSNKINSTPASKIIVNNTPQTPGVAIKGSIYTQKDLITANFSNSTPENTALQNLKNNQYKSLDAKANQSTQEGSKNKNAIKEEFNKEIIISPPSEIEDEDTENRAIPANSDTKSSGILKSKIQKPKAKITTKASTIIKPPKKTRPQARIYAGIIIGPEVSTVKFQKTTKTGFTGGIIAGYKINKKWSIESGFYLDKKYYYTKGKYFKTNKIPMPYYIKIVNASGDCNMIEWPVNIKYDFKSTKKGNWFALLGSSSYFMKKEYYSYKFVNNYGQHTEKQASYKNSSKDWASIINLSAGFTRNFGKTGVLRIEPYIKIPVSGIGIGSLPITSSGVYLGFTKNLF